ncbi:hypothetical protein ACFSWE_08515 [Leucobacter albus]|uniref:Uncharacterized protein n=1 Tax=Leucobacter albus TaxID=272210 RepID=A0ABW3TTF9_9MICO
MSGQTHDPAYELLSAAVQSAEMAMFTGTLTIGHNPAAATEHIDEAIAALTAAREQLAAQARSPRR